ITENMDTVLLDPPLVALDKDAPVPFRERHWRRVLRHHLQIPELRLPLGLTHDTCMTWTCLSSSSQAICDKEWHYYVINVEFPAVTLFVDGVTYEPYLVTDDWPIHSAQIDTQLTVGACWQGGEVTTPRFTQYFRGSLSGLTIRPGRIETQKVISCLQACKEGLDINSLESLGKDIKFHFNPAQSVLVVEGEEVSSINTAMTKVSYINSRQFPTPGLRRVHITTTVQCFGEDSCLSIPDIKAVVMVLPPSEPRITIRGSNRLVRPASDMHGPLGVAPFKDLRITSTVVKGEGSALGGAHRPGVMEVMHNLDYCDILVLGEELNPQRESLEIQRSALTGKHLDATNSTSGISIYGVDSMAHYEQAVRQVRYRHSQPSTLSGRRFRLTCSELNGRYTSNKFNMEVGVLHHTAPVEHVNHMAAQSQYLRPVHHPLMIHTLNSQMQAAPPAATVVIVVCIAALVVIVVLGIYRIHTTQQESRDDEDEGKDQDVEWDTASLTITVNPMEEVRGGEYEEEEETGAATSAESDDSEQDDDEEEEEEEEEEREAQAERKSRRKTEWDSSSSVRY
uniref:Calsyntenin 2a n=1 Tax=Gadus morhua TaxID=8049 RepID=A0A8C4Z915_GADMO